MTDEPIISVADEEVCRECGSVEPHHKCSCIFHDTQACLRKRIEALKEATLPSLRSLPNGQPDQTMDFMEAVAFMKAGKRMKSLHNGRRYFVSASGLLSDEIVVQSIEGRWVEDPW
jgi:hypothetical protein